METIVTGRHCTISDALKDQIIERIESVEKINERVIRVEVELTATEAKGSPEGAIEAQITLRGKGPVVRATATGDDKLLAFERAFERLKSQMRKAGDRRKKHRGLRPVGAVPEIVRAVEQEEFPEKRIVAGIEVVGDGPLVVKEKNFPATPLTLVQALDEMELVGHDFFLFVDAVTGAPSVVYRRKAYDYGVIHLDVS
ncbi:MAG TPA: ribosome-associated translation inhibitor RaiA [Propionibacteriaceae bacterium]|nr:ribosome-associated translation inhibitor RaiA [Propionibacteriaceae bacterium]